MSPVSVRALERLDTLIKDIYLLIYPEHPFLIGFIFTGNVTWVGRSSMEVSMNLEQVSFNRILQ